MLSSFSEYPPMNVSFFPDREAVALSGATPVEYKYIKLTNGAMLLQNPVEICFVGANRVLA